MPTISRFYGIEIIMRFNEKHSPHFHAHYGEYRALIGIASGQVISGRLPRRAFRFVNEWAHVHRQELQANWERARQAESLIRIEPLK
ncbi:MAG: DUF4160 domain-containing protein [Chloroflexi bacterium]|nr:DUF4160 domain-containing protein [Chloroflexota bacterium]